MTQPSSPRPVAIRAPHGASIFQVDWSDGGTSRIPHRVLRGYCPCAGCQGHSGPTRFVAAGNLELRDVARVGNYALGLTWGDAHSSGIYTFSFLRELGDLVARLGEEQVVALGELGAAASPR